MHEAQASVAEDQNRHVTFQSSHHLNLHTSRGRAIIIDATTFPPANNHQSLPSTNPEKLL